MRRQDDPAVHGCVLTPGEVQRIREVLARLTPEYIDDAVKRILQGRADYSYPVECGAYRAVAEDVVAVVSRVLDGAHLSCAKCERDCMEGEP